MNKIPFSKNWNNKLHCDIFSTIRKFNKEKYKYYVKNLNEIFEIELNGKIVGKAKLFDIQINAYHKLDCDLLFYDTGIPSKAVIDRTFSGFGIDYEDICIILWFDRRIK